MPRPPRINLEGGFYHLLHRGNYRQDVFLGDRDREALLDRLGTCARLFRVRVHVYCLMTNHLHLLVETRLPDLSAFGQRLFASYTLWFNRKHRRVGRRIWTTCTRGSGRHGRRPWRTVRFWERKGSWNG